MVTDDLAANRAAAQGGRRHLPSESNGSNVVPHGPGERTGTEALRVSSSRQGRLFQKYVLTFVVLVSGALLTSGLVGAHFVYEENQAAVIRLQRERAVAAATTIEQFLRETEHLLGWVSLPPSTTEPTLEQQLEQRRTDYERLLHLASSVQDIRYLDAAGTEQLRVSRREPGRPASRGDYSQEAWFLEARSRGVSLGPVGFGDGSEPFVLLALV